MNEKDRRIEEVREIIAPERIAVVSSKKLQVNKKTGQFSIKIPKSFAERAGLSEKTFAHIIFRPNEGSFKEAVKTDLIIYFNEVENERKEESPKRQRKNNR
jgi:hypothetical protein